MKYKLPVLAIIMMFTFLSGFSQNRSITFIEKPWSDILSQAKTEKKMIFLDAYTTWCGPCKWMAANMFTNDTIADYFNRTFLCAHFDMEKGEGIQLAKTYQVSAYPTLLFINMDGEVVHKRVGAPQKVSDYLEMGAIALTPGEGLIDYVKKFQAGNRDPKFMMKYLDRLQGAYIPINEPLAQYFATQKETDLTNRDNWTIIDVYLTDMDSKEFNFVVSHYDEFAKLYTADSVDNKIFNVYLQAMSNMARSRSFSETSYAGLKQKITASGFKEAGKVIFTGDLNLYQMRGEQDKFLNLAMTGLDKYYGKDYAMLNRMAWYFFQIASDPKYLEKAADWAKKSISIQSTHENNDTYANLMFKLGNKNEAVKYEKTAIELARKVNAPLQTYEESLKKFEE